MATTLKITEGVPASYPTIETGLTSPSAEFLSAVWRRIESYIAWRWNERSCEFIASGDGFWEPPLKPATFTATEYWNSSDAWEEVTLRPSPLGGYLLDSGTYRFTATLGDTETPPGVIQEAYIRLANYLNEMDGRELSLKATSIEGIGSFEFAAPNLAARAMQFSGAADLLRPFRNLGAN